MNALHERNYFLRAKLKGQKLLSEAVAAQLDVPWRTNGFIAQAVFFLLTCMALGAFYGFLDLAGNQSEGLIVGIAAIVIAEYLIGIRRWFFTGVEAGLWLGGMYALISELPSSGKPEAMLVLAAGAAIPGWRVRNPLFGAVAAYFVMLYFEKRFDLGVVCALLLTVGAALALLRSWKRPTTEWLWIAIALVLPFAGIDEAGIEWRDVTIILYAAAGFFVLYLAFRRRHHALFLSAMILLAIAAVELSKKIDAPEEAKLAFDGVVLMTIAFLLSRALRDRTTGYVLAPMELTPLDDAVEVAATLAHQPRATAPAQATPVSGGGGFGGAGASGDY
jgi:hypothetical protein